MNTLIGMKILIWGFMINKSGAHSMDGSRMLMLPISILRDVGHTVYIFHFPALMPSFICQIGLLQYITLSSVV